MHVEVYAESFKRFAPFPLPVKRMKGTCCLKFEDVREDVHSERATAERNRIAMKSAQGMTPSSRIIPYSVGDIALLQYVGIIPSKILMTLTDRRRDKRSILNATFS